MKNNQRLSYRRLAEELAERGLVAHETLNEILDHASRGGPALPIALVEENFVSDWELSRVVCEIYNLPFLTADMAKPVPDAAEGLDPIFLLDHGLVPLARHNALLTVLMPGIVSADVLQLLSAACNCSVLPVVGTVRSNRQWLGEQFGAASDASVTGEQGWSSIFDDADAAVLQDIELQQEEELAGARDDALTSAPSLARQPDPDETARTGFLEDMA